MPLETSQEISQAKFESSAVDEATSQSTATFRPPPLQIRELNDTDLRGANPQWREARRRVHRALWAQAMAGSVSSFGLFAIATNSEAVLRIMTRIGVALGLGTEGVFVLMLLLPLL